MTITRLRQVARLAGRVPERKARELYQEVFGAEASPLVPEARVRASLREACEELLEKEVQP